LGEPCEFPENGVGLRQIDFRPIAISPNRDVALNSRKRDFTPQNNGRVLACACVDANGLNFLREAQLHKKKVVNNKSKLQKNKIQPKKEEKKKEKKKKMKKKKFLARFAFISSRGSRERCSTGGYNALEGGRTELTVARVERPRFQKLKMFFGRVGGIKGMGGAERARPGWLGRSTGRLRDKGRCGGEKAQTRRGEVVRIENAPRAKNCVPSARQKKKKKKEKEKSDIP